MNDTAWFLLVLAGLAIALAALYRATVRRSRGRSVSRRSREAARPRASIR
jgi:hypothetical protein